MICESDGYFFDFEVKGKGCKFYFNLKSIVDKIDFVKVNIF